MLKMVRYDVKMVVCKLFRLAVLQDLDRATFLEILHQMLKFYQPLIHGNNNSNNNNNDNNNNRSNRLRFVLPISSHVTILLESFSFILLLAFTAQLCMACREIKGC